MRTSQSHPIQIAAVRPTPAHGRIGITFCPGKKDPNGGTGAWHRDLDVDVDEIRKWGAALVLSLVEKHELENLQVRELGSVVRSRGMEWVHFPIEDRSIPDEARETKWRETGAYVRSLLRNRSDVLIHCRGGLGRAGSMAARLLVELGKTPEKAIEVVRSVRPGAIETDEQEWMVRKTKVVLVCVKGGQ